MSVQMKSHMLEQTGERVSAVLKEIQGLILGDATAVSTRMHSVHPRRPGIIWALETDAGQGFYTRQRPHEIVHVDCFHERGQLNHYYLAQFLLDQADALIHDYGLPEDFFDHIDIQTGTGGGRLTGSLIYGQKETLKIVHKNHVHLALYCEDKHYPFLLPLVWHLEQGILDQGFQLQKITRLYIKKFQEIEGHGGGGLDHYSSYSDSKLKQQSADMEHCKGNRRGKNQDVVDLVKVQGDLNHTEKLLNALKNGIPAKEFVSTYSQGKLTMLLNKNIVQQKGHNIYLTPYGAGVCEYFENHLLDIKATLRRSAENFNLPREGHLEVSKIRSGAQKFRTVLEEKGRQAKTPEPHEPIHEIDIPETIVAAAKRCYQKEEAAFNIQPPDFRVKRYKYCVALNVCLVIDASGSMMGKRMREVKYLAEHLLLTSRDYLSIIIFQESKAELIVPYTRNWEVLRAGLAKVTAGGLTPMVKGLEAGRTYLKTEPDKLRNSLMVLITDGLPTISSEGEDPFRATLMEGRKLAQDNINFTCIGLDPNIEFLRNLSEVTGGSLYVMNELERESLAQVIQSEKAQ